MGTNLLQNITAVGTKKNSQSNIVPVVLFENGEFLLY